MTLTRAVIALSVIAVLYGASIAYAQVLTPIFEISSLLDGKK